MAGDGAQKDFGISQLNTRWVLVLDADEELTVELSASIKSILKFPQNSFYKMHRRSYFLGKIIRHGDWGKDWIIRLFEKEKYQWTKDIVHSRLNVSKKKAKKLKGKLIHYSQDSISESLCKANNYSSASSEILFNKGKKIGVFTVRLHEYWTFFRSFFMRCGFLDGYRGYLVAKLSAYGCYLKYFKLWQKLHNKS